MKTIAITFGRFNLAHQGHIHLVHEMSKLADIVILGVSSSRKNLPVEARLGLIKALGLPANVRIRTHPTVFKLVEEAFATYGEDVQIIPTFGEDRAEIGSQLAKYFPNNILSTHVVERSNGLSSTLIRHKLANNEPLSDIYTPTQERLVRRLYNLEQQR